MISDAKKDSQLVTNDWNFIYEKIPGVAIKEVLHVPGDNGVITEIYRPEWDTTGLPVVQCYQSRLFPGTIGAWSYHAKQIDRLFVNQGYLKVVLFDGRQDSASYGLINEFRIGDSRPTFIVIPPGVWHGVQNLGTIDALMLNFPTIQYQYEDPDHYRLPHDSEQIPYSWASGGQMTRTHSSR